MAISIHIYGLVQGVGFRPFVWHLARTCQITGTVYNDAEGVVIHAWGDETALERFQRLLSEQAPPLSRIDNIECQPLTGTAPDSFTIEASISQGNSSAAVTPDAATCPACLADIADPENRHSDYPFTSCTYCGPRLSIVENVPYDRANTSMAAFPMCAACQADYNDPGNRRFHAQAIACPECGPQLWLEDAAGTLSPQPDAAATIAATASLLRAGKIIAIKGIGGFHLAVDAGNATAVARLRQRKLRYAKPFALMAADLESIARYAEMSPHEQKLLSSPAAPIVLLERKANCAELAREVAPGESRLGFMLPYSPLHTLIFAHLERPIVLTSGNRSDEPQCIDNDDARHRLLAIADHFLMNDRNIVNRLDDSVALFMAGENRLLRRARGYAPAPMLLHESFAAAPPILAMGGELKNSFCQLADGTAVVSQHIGDLENALSHNDYRQALALYRQLFDFRPQAIAIDTHPDYFSGQLGRQMAEQAGLSLVACQHHHAHIAAVMAEHALPVDAGPVLGIALDGLGFGDDDTIWGGEFLIADFTGFHRAGFFQPVALIGGTRAIHEPWRNSFAHLHAAGWERIKRDFDNSDIVRFLEQKPLDLLMQMAEKGLNSPLSSSCGRLFDAAAAVLGICRDQVGYEAQAAIELESLARSGCSDKARPYPFRLEQQSDDSIMINWQPMWPALLDDLENDTPPAVVAARFHDTVIKAVSDLAGEICRAHQLATVVLCGGAFQNRLLLEGVTSALNGQGIESLIPRQLPMNDGGLSLGQAAIAAARLLVSEAEDETA